MINLKKDNIIDLHIVICRSILWKPHCHLTLTLAMALPWLWPKNWSWIKLALIKNCYSVYTIWHFRCECGNCTVMPKPEECLCCKESPQVWGQVETYNNTVSAEEQLNCMAEHPGFQSGCLDIWVLQIAYIQFRNQYHERLHLPLNECVKIYFHYCSIYVHV